MRCSRTIATLFFLPAVMLPAAAQTVVYVDDDASANGDGTTWVTAYRHLQDALAAASGGSNAEIRVAQGTYRPDQTEGGSPMPGDRQASFELINGVALYGGYAGLGAPDPDLRDVEAHLTILSGDLAANDGPSFSNCEENSYHVVTGSDTDSTAILDGFTITAGYADYGNPSLDQHGAGMLNVNASCTVSRCTFLANTTQSYSGDGAGMYNSGGAPIVTDCAFIGNRICQHFGNGAGIYNTNSAATIARCTFIDNSATAGAALYTYRNTPLVSDCLFRGNSASAGGAMANNYADSWIINCRFLGNHAGSLGGAVYDSYGDPKYIHCEFIGNTALGSGGGSYCYYSNPTFTNCAIVGNVSTLGEYGGICNSASDPLVTNCIVWGNRGASGVTPVSQIGNDDPYGPSAPVVNHSCIQGGWTGAGGAGNVSGQPRFAREPSDGGDGWGVGDNDDYGDLRLTSGSPCIDVGDNNADTDQSAAGIQPLPAADADGNARIIDDPIAPDAGTPPIVDLGAYEYQADCNTNTVPDSVDLDSGTSLDCNGNGVPDECEPQDDCNHNAVRDICDIAAGTGADCNRNGILDECDIRDGAASDVNSSGVPDVCERNLTGYWQLDFSPDTGCYIIDEYLTERRYLRFDDTDSLVESWIPTGGQYIKMNYPHIDGPSYHRYRLNGLHTANTNRSIASVTFASYAGVMQFVEDVSITDEDHVTYPSEEGSEVGQSLLTGAMDPSGLTMQGLWWFYEEHQALCGVFTATRLPGPPPVLPSVIDLEWVGLELSTTDLVRPGSVEVAHREYRVRSSFLEQDVTIQYLLSTNGVVDLNDVVIGSETIYPGPDGLLGPHAGPGPTLSIPQCLPPPDGYSFLAVVDAAGVLSETDESNNVFALPVTITPPPLPADFECDGDVDWDDYEIFEVCLWLSGPGEPPPFAECLNVFDFDSDVDVDLGDARAFQEAFTG